MGRTTRRPRDQGCDIVGRCGSVGSEGKKGLRRTEPRVLSIPPHPNPGHALFDGLWPTYFSLLRLLGRDYFLARATLHCVGACRPGGLGTAADALS